jgi:FMN phosphatase YigB (HAD superfamily)
MRIVRLPYGVGCEFDRIRTFGPRSSVCPRAARASVRVYKPSPRVYQLAVDALGIPTGELVFVSSNGWDAAGARAFGLPVVWINRSACPVERLGFAPDAVVPDLDALATLLGAGADER